MDPMLCSPLRGKVGELCALSANLGESMTSRERFPTFGEELALINFCNKKGPRGNTHLRAVLIVAADTGLRENELFTLEKGDIDFGTGVINVRAINAKTNRPRTIPMTRRVREEL